MSDIVNIKNLDELDAEYVLICKDADDIFNDIKFNNKKEEDTCRIIVDFIEKTVSQGISNFKAMSLPFIGVLRYNPVDKAMTAHYKELKLARQVMDKDEYKEYAKGIYYYEQDKIKAETIRKRVLDRIKKRNRKRYIKYCTTLGKAYADAFLYCMSIFEEVPFNFELQEQYDELTNRKHN